MNLNSSDKVLDMLTLGYAKEGCLNVSILVADDDLRWKTQKNKNPVMQRKIAIQENIKHKTSKGEA